MHESNVKYYRTIPRSTIIITLIMIIGFSNVSFYPYGFETRNLANAQTDIDNNSESNNQTTTTGSTTTYPSVHSQEAPSPNRQITLVAEDVELEIAPGKRVKTWTFNGTVPGPTIRMAEGESISVKFINKSPIPHTIHFHGNHDDTNDGVLPQVMPNQTYIYNITGEPAGALMYHCHAPPVSLHLRMGMYGALIVDPKDQPLKPAKEFFMVLGEYDLEDQLGLEADYYLINGYADQYMRNPITINDGELLRLYVINLGTTIPAPFHLHSATFMAYPSGLWGNEPQHVQTIPIAPGDASIIEVKWKYPGTYLFHSHGIQEEHGNMGQINVVGSSGTYGDKNVDVSSSMHGINNANSSNISSNNSTTASALTESVSMFDWQYELQKSLQKPQVINYTQEPEDEQKTITASEKRQERGEEISLQADSSLATNITDTNNTDVTLIDNNTNNTDGNNGSNTVSIVSGSGNPDSEEFYSPSNAEVKLGTTVTWTNDDTLPHTVTSGTAETGPTGDFDSGIVNAQGTFTHTFEKEGVYDYYCIIHPWMVGQVTVEG